MNKLYEKMIANYISDNNLMGKEPEVVVKALATNMKKELVLAGASIGAFRDDRYSSLIIEDKSCSVWMEDWPKGVAGNPIHDHGDSHGSILVVRGTLTETRYITGDQVTKYFSGDDIITFPVGYIHKFEPGEGDTGLTLHVYCGPLRKMTYYEWDGNILAPNGGWEESKP